MLKQSTSLAQMKKTHWKHNSTVGHYVSGRWWICWFIVAFCPIRLVSDHDLKALERFGHVWEKQQHPQEPSGNPPAAPPKRGPSQNWTKFPFEPGVVGRWNIHGETGRSGQLYLVSVCSIPKKGSQYETYIYIYISLSWKTIISLEIGGARNGFADGLWGLWGWARGCGCKVWPHPPATPPPALKSRPYRRTPRGSRSNPFYGGRRPSAGTRKLRFGR